MFFERRRFVDWIIAGMLAGVTFLPLLLDLRLTIENIQHIVAFFRDEHAHYYQTVYTVPFYWNNIPRFFELVLGLGSDGFMEGRFVFLSTLIYLFIVSMRDLFTKRRLRPSSLFALVFVVSLIGLRLYKGDKLEYYMLFMLAIPAISLGVLFSIIPKKLKLLALALICVVLLRASFTSPAVTQKRQRDFQVMQILIEHVEREFGSNYYIAGVPYTFLRDPMFYAWKYTYHKMPWMDEYRNEGIHLYICSPDQRCSDGYTSNTRGMSIPTDLVLETELRKGYVYRRSFEFDYEDRRFVVVSYEK